MEPKMKFFYPHVKGIDVDNRRITVCISKDEIDRHNERIEISAIAEALSLYATNPCVLGDHQHRLSTGKSSVIGHAIPETFNVLKDEVDIDIEFSTTENAETYWVNFRDGHQKAISIGFRDLEWRFEEVDGRKIYVTTKLDLVEVSCVAVGANRGALIKAKGMFDKEVEVENAKAVKNVLDKTIKNHLDEFLVRIEDQFDEIKSLLIADPNALAEELLGAPPAAHVRSDDKNAERILKKLEDIKNKIQSG